MNKVLYIINPVGHGGAGLKAWDAFKSAWVEPIDPAQVVFTERPSHAREIAATCAGCEILVAVGGDGTVGEVISGIMDRPGSKPRLAVIPCGTGNDVAQNAGILSVADAAAALREGISHTFDLIRVDGPDAHRHAFLFANAGFSSIPTMQLWMKRLLGATGAYYLATFLQVLAYRAPHMTVRIDGQKHAGPTYLLIVGNAEWAAGGSMRICPGACTADGELNVVIIAPMSIFRIVTKLFSSIAKGTHIDLPEVDYFTGRKIEVYSDPPTLLDLDGDLFGTTPVVISVVPQAMELLVGNSRDYRRT